MKTAKLKKFAQFARRSLMEQVSAKLKQVLADNSPARRENTKAISLLEKAVREHGKEQVIERVAYTWFNRFCALRFMDVNRYARIGVVSPAKGQFQPEILAEAKMGHIDENMVSVKIRQQVFALLDGKSPSHDPQGEAFRLLLVAVCNSWHRAMSFLFEQINDYTELLMPDDLLSGNSILAHIREAMTPDDCEGVEVIGWLYQFYISEKKDAVFAGLKKNKKITPENIPAATQLFTPHWIVRYLVENSLGRLWMLNRPNSRLIERMEYYIKHEQPETDFLQINNPEEIKFCDPACGSGHILAYAFDLFYAMYEEEGYEPAEIPGKILTCNLYGIEIDERAGTLASFALTMKARTRHRRFFRRPVTPNICVLKNIQFDDKEINEYMDFIGRDLFTSPLQTTLRQFEEADNFGSLIRPDVTDVAGLLKILESKNIEEHMFLSQPHKKVLQVLRQADYLSPKYHVVAANPPYKKKADLNDNLQAWLEGYFIDGKYDLYQAFILRNTKLAVAYGYVGMITMQGWMFAPRYQAIRSNILTNCSILSMAQLGERAFDSIGGEVVSTTAFVLSNNRSPSLKGQFLRLTEGKNEDEKNLALLSAAKNPKSDIRFSASDDDFLIIPGQPIVFWASEQVRLAFHNHPTISEYIVTREGLTTGSNALFLREWHEVSQVDVAYGITNEVSAQESKKRWFPYVKGGGSRRWYGNFEHFVNWFDDGVELKNFKDKKTGRIRSHNYNGIYGFKAGFTWSGISSNDFAVRDVPVGFMFDAKGPMGFVNSSVPCELIEAFLNSTVSSSFLRMIAPTLDFKLTHVLSLPLSQVDDPALSGRIKKNVFLAKEDWDSYETSWDFTSLPLLSPDDCQPTLKSTYQKLRAHWQEMVLEMQRLEEENNRIFIEAYGLQDELTPEVPLKEITLTCNPHYRYGVEECEVGSEKWEEMEARLLQDTMKELVSYAVGCMFGRYSLDMPGLVLANQGEGIEEYHRKIGEYRVNECKKLSGTDRLAEIHGYGGDDLSGHTAISQRGALRSDESDSQGSGVGSLQHSGGSGEAINSRVQKFFVDNTGFPSGSGNPSDDRSAIRLSPAGEGRTNPESIRENQTHDLFSDSEAALTSHFPLPTSHFLPDEDNVIPLLNADWFSDDITERFKQFLRVTFGEEHYEENLTFIEQALNIKGKRSYTLRDYFLGEFYSDHVRRYKKRPIYWLFSSPKGSFNALIYMHRYQPYTASTVLSYLRDFKNEKLRAHKNQLEAVSISASASKSEKTRALKEIEKMNKIITELETYERDTLYPLATKQVEIDLDDGVKVNYPKFGAALKKIPGLT